MEKATTDLVVVGHFAIDFISLPNRDQPIRILGGAVAYTSLVARVLGGSVSIISKVGSDFPQEWLSSLSQKNINLTNVVTDPQNKTTNYELKYNKDFSSRTLRLKTQGSQITLNDLPASIQSKAVHIAPIDAEISPEVIRRLRSFTDCLSLDPQGMTRRFDAEGNVKCSLETDKHVLDLINIYKSSVDEALTLTEKTDINQAAKAIHDLGPQIVIITSGNKGSTLSIEGTVWTVPACRPRRVVDPTGAGDVFIGAFLTEYVHKKDPLWSACVGSAAASQVVENIGTTFFGDKNEIYRRADALYEKEIKH